MNELAKELNEVLDRSIAGEFISDLGRRMFFPKGIVAQSAEARNLATRYNATVGLAVKSGEPMYLSDIYNQFDGNFTPAQLFNYAPGGGDKELRKLWKEEMIRKNPSLEGQQFSLPIVTSGLTHGLSMISEMFCQKGDTIIIPDLAWDNYDLINCTLNQCTISTFATYDEHRHYNVDALVAKIRESEDKKARILLNFPNNPTGYSLSNREMDKLEKSLIALAEEGYRLMVITDDAYFGLFYEEDTAKESLFARLCNAHPGIFCVKGDAATKEAMVWGFRMGFITFGGKSLDAECYDALEKKMMGIIRATVSNCCRPSQTLLMHAMKDPSYEGDKQFVHRVMNARYTILKEALRKYGNRKDLLDPYPFNSGYFMAFKTAGSAEELRVKLLNEYGIGCINIQDRALRVAYCSVPSRYIDDLIKKIYQAAEELWT